MANKSLNFTRTEILLQMYHIRCWHLRNPPTRRSARQYRSAHNGPSIPHEGSPLLHNRNRFYLPEITRSSSLQGNGGWLLHHCSGPRQRRYVCTVICYCWATASSSSCRLRNVPHLFSQRHSGRALPSIRWSVRLILLNLSKFINLNSLGIVSSTHVHVS